MKMKGYLICFLLFFSSITLQSEEKFSWFITINTNECISCLNQLKLLPDLDSNYSKTLVFTKGDQPDSATLIENYFLDKFKGKIIFSDSLYRHFKYKGHLQESSVTLYNNENKQSIIIALSQLASKNIDLNRYLKDRDTLIFPEIINSNNRYAQIGKDNIYSFNRSKNLVTSFSRLTMKKSYEIKLTDTLLDLGYQIKYGNRNAKLIAKKAADFIQRNKAIGEDNKIIGYQADADTVTILVSQPFVIHLTDPAPDQSDSVINHFFTLFSFIKGRLNKSLNIETYTDNLNSDSLGLRRNIERDKYDCYFLASQFFKYNNRLFFYIFSGFVYEGAPNWAVAEYKYQSASRMVFKQYTQELPTFYIKNRIGYNYTTNAFSFYHFGSYFTFDLADTIYSVDTEMTNIPIPFIPKRDSNFKVLVRQFKIDNNNILYVLIFDQRSSNERVYYKYDLNHKKLLSESKLTNGLPPGSDYSFNIDPFDYNYILIANGEKVIRKKIFE